MAPLLLLAGLAAAGPLLPCGVPLLQPLPPLDVPPAPPAVGDKVERDAYGTFPNSLQSENFIVKWGDRGGVDPDEVQALLDAFEDGWAVEIETMAHPAPPSTDTYLFNVYIGNTGSDTPDDYGAAGYYNPDDDGYPMIVIAQDTLKDAAYMEITAVHEFYHAIQNGLDAYTYTGDAAWYWEATADWVASQVYPDNLNYAVFLVGFAYLPYLPVNYFNYPDSGALDEYHQYGAFIFPLFLTEQVADWTLVRDSWVDAESNDPLDELDRLLQAGYGTSINEVYPSFAAHNATWDYANGDDYDAALDSYTFWYGDEDARIIDSYNEEGTDGDVSPPPETLPQRYGYNVFEVRSPRAGAYDVQFTGDAAGSNENAATFAVTLVAETDGVASYTPLPLTDNAGAAQIATTGEESSLYLVVSAWSDRHRDDETFGYTFRITPGEAPDSPAPEDDTADDTGGTGVLKDPEPKACACAAASPTGGAWAGLALGLALSRRRSRASR